MLSAIYNSGQIALVGTFGGWSLNTNGHYAEYGSMNVVFGPNYKKYETWTDIMDVTPAISAHADFELRAITEVRATVYINGETTQYHSTNQNNISSSSSNSTLNRAK